MASFVEHVAVNYSCLNVLVPEQLLQRTDVTTILRQVQNNLKTCQEQDKFSKKAKNCCFLVSSFRSLRLKRLYLSHPTSDFPTEDLGAYDPEYNSVVHPPGWI